MSFSFVIFLWSLNEKRWRRAAVKQQLFPMFIPIRMPLDLDLDPFPSTKHFLFPCISLLFMKITSCHSSLNQGSTRTYLGILVLLQEEENRQTDTTRSWVFPCQKERAPGNNFLVMSEHDLVVVKCVFLFVTRPKSSAWFWPSVLLQRFGERVWLCSRPACDRLLPRHFWKPPPLFRLLYSTGWLTSNCIACILICQTWSTW